MTLKEKAVEVDPQRAQETPFLVVFLSVPELAVQPWAGHISDLDLGVLITKTKAGFPEYWSMEEYWGSCIRISCRAFHFLKKILFTWLFLERGEGREKERERNIHQLPLFHTLGIEPAIFRFATQC